jgi:hypothetical protein
METLDKHIKLLERIKIQLQGHIFVGNEKKEGWKDSAPFYMFKCPEHGYVKNYVKGFKQRLECPQCLKEMKKAETISKPSISQ